MIQWNFLSTNYSEDCSPSQSLVNPSPLPPPSPHEKYLMSEILACVHIRLPGQQESVYRYSRNVRKVSLEIPKTGTRKLFDSK